MDAHEIHHAFNQETRQHLDMKTAAPWVILEDTSVPRAERYRQAFCAVFPDSEAAAGIVVIADDVDSIPGETGANPLAAWWGKFIEIIRAPIQLPGNVLLELSPGDVGKEAAEVGDTAAAESVITEELN